MGDTMTTNADLLARLAREAAALSSDYRAVATWSNQHPEVRLAVSSVPALSRTLYAFADTVGGWDRWCAALRDGAPSDAMTDESRTPGGYRLRTRTFGTVTVEVLCGADTAND